MRQQQAAAAAGRSADHPAVRRQGHPTGLGVAFQSGRDHDRLGPRPDPPSKYGAPPNAPQPPIPYGPPSGTSHDCDARRAQRGQGALCHRRSPPSDDFDPQGRVEPEQVVGVACEHGVATLTGAPHDRCVDDVSHTGHTGHTAELSHRSSGTVVERDNLSCSGGEQSHQSNLTTAVTPSLRNHAGRYRDAIPSLVGTGDQRDDRPLIALKRDEGSGIEGEAAHPSSTASAAARSSSVRGPPEAASISARRSARSSSFNLLLQGARHIGAHRCRTSLRYGPARLSDEFGRQTHRHLRLCHTNQNAPRGSNTRGGFAAFSWFAGAADVASQRCAAATHNTRRSGDSPSSTARPVTSWRDRCPVAGRRPPLPPRWWHWARRDTRSTAFEVMGGGRPLAHSRATANSDATIRQWDRTSPVAIRCACSPAIPMVHGVTAGCSPLRSRIPPSGWSSSPRCRSRRTWSATSHGEPGGVQSRRHAGVSAGSGAVTLLWNIDPEAAQRRLCDVIGCGARPDEWCQIALHRP